MITTLPIPMSSSPISPLEATQPFIVLDASAGSGKTYSLVQHILLNALRPKNMPNAYQKVLAITFTNNAAEEMKARLLKQLLDFGKDPSPTSNEFFTPIAKTLNISVEELQRRANAAASHMLHHYSSLNVGTIDNFTHRLVRTFTKDLDLDDNFEVRLDLDGMVAEALDLLYSTLGDRPELRNTLVALVQERMNRNKGHNPDSTLKKEGMNSFNEGAHEHLKKLPSPSRMMEIEQELNVELDKIIKEGRQISNKVRAHFKAYGYEGTPDMTNFPTVKKNLYKEWQNLRRNDLEAGPAVWKSRAKKDGIQEWEALRDEAFAFQDAQQSKLQLLKLATAKLQQLAATRALLDKFDEIQQNQNTMPLSAFNKLISEELQREPTAFIYARLGEKFWHFYIDEFQDTSTMQFENIHPLIEHTLTKDENENSALIVGDAKQSIYRWRGGRAEQFMSLVQGHHPANRFEGLPQGHELYGRETIQLENNFRTHGAIVKFNNAFFPKLAEALTLSDHVKAYRPEGVTQKPRVSEDDGEVRVDFFSHEKGKGRSAEEFEELICEATLDRIQELLKSGYDYNDIALLVRGNSQGKRLANFLTSKHIPVLSADSLVLSNAHESALILSAAKLFVQGGDKPARFELAYALTKLGTLPKEADHFTFQKDVVDRGIPALIQYFPLAAGLLDAAENLFTFGVRVFDTFGLLDAPNAMVDASLDLLFQFQSNDGTFATLPQWWNEESPKCNVPVPEDMPSVRVMTIHKSKGLEFEHVIMPFEVNFKDSDTEHWIPFPHHDELKRLPVKKTKDTAALFPEELAIQIDNENHFDWMNMIYVAMTRPVAGLHLFFCANKAGKFGKAIAEHLEWGEGAGSKRIGTPVPARQKKAHDRNTPTQGGIGHFSPAHLRMKTTAPKGWEEGGADARKWGTALHRILQLPREVQSTGLDRLYRSGEFSESMQDRAAKVLGDLDQKSAWKALEENEAVVYVERSIVGPEGTQRPDLIIASEQRAFVIDYKTGTHKDAYDDQLAGYVEALEATFNEVDGELWFI